MNYLFGDEGFQRLNTYISTGNFSKIFLITDTNTHKYCIPVFKTYLNMFTNVNIIKIPAGEENKNLDTLQQIWKSLLDKGGDRNALIINLGGGVITDIGGFAAATFKRGVRFIHIPTTLLSMVDAAIGGKNGINFNGIKNQIGTIVQPELVLISPEFLKTLPIEQMKSGYAEMLKHGLIADKNYWDNLKTNYDTLIELQDMKIVLDLIRKSVEIKNTVITSDPKEQGLRKILNFGHTFGHAIEAMYFYDRKQTITHGKAVAAGMVLAAYISSELFELSHQVTGEIKNFINNIYTIEKFSPKEIDLIVKYLIFDKKNENGQINFVLLKNIADPVWNIQVPDTIIHKAFEYYST